MKLPPLLDSKKGNNNIIIVTDCPPLKELR